MSQRESSGSRKSTVLFLVCLAAGVIVGAICVWPEPALEANAATAAPAEREAPQDPSSATAEDQQQPAMDRVAVTAPVARPNRAAPPLAFEECVAKLCEMGLRTAELAEEDEVEAAQELNEQVRELLGQVMEQFADAGERSLAMLVEMSGGPELEPRPALDNTKLGVLQLLLQAELTRRNQLADIVEDRSRVDALAQAMLDSMPIGSATAQMGERCLHQAPYLRLTHEPSVLHLLTLASEEQFPRDIATKLLMTLWDNMLAAGERSSDELSQLAMLKLDSGDPSEIVAACRQLLADARYRAVVLSWMRDQKSQELAIDIAALAAKELHVKDALEVLRELSPLLQGTRGTYMTLGIRSPHAVAEAYRKHLAANNHPDVRGELIMGVGMLPDAVGLPVAELALANDPSPEVRIQAMYVFTVHAAPEAAERAVNQLLDDPVIANDSLRLGSIVLALQNLEQGDPNRIARLAARLKSLPLADYSRIALKAILDRCLPGGAPTGGD
tara:strand:+ start:27095 stop:28597 length:1503 start_codon:yes stop_codon:yes gene_type:complete